MEKVTHEDIARALRDALEKAQAAAPEIDYSTGISTSEFAEYLGISQTSVRKLIKRGIEAGAVEYVGRVARLNTIREVSKVPVYRPVRAE